LLRLFAGFAVMLMAGPAFAQFELPDSKPDPAALFRGQCATCHSLNPADPPRQGPTLAGVIGRHAGSVAGFHYSPGFAKADFTWDAAHLDAYLTNPQSVVPGAVMPYRQAKPEIRQAIIGYLQEQK
jgi:cytochrome c